MSVLTPVVTEKSYAGAPKGTYTFKVPDGTPKPQIAKLVEASWDVKVVSVRTSKVPPKTRMRGRVKGIKPGYTKAVVQLKKGDTIDELGVGGGE
jgi:large subunit ribosomal protein L23